VIISSLVPYIKNNIAITASELSIITAIPVVLGSILRVPIGYSTNKYGARLIFLISLVFLILPVYYISIANSVIDLTEGKKEKSSFSRI
jgi:NNP family nitrate/nitrite transporter-like MFS transporter